MSWPAQCTGEQDALRRKHAVDRLSEVLHAAEKPSLALFHLPFSGEYRHAA